MIEEKEEVRFLAEGWYTQSDLTRIITYFDRNNTPKPHYSALKDAVRYYKEIKNGPLPSNRSTTD